MNLLISVVVFQTALFLYAKRYPQQYMLITTVCLWLFPGLFALRSSIKLNIRFLTIWILFTCGNFYILYLVFVKPFASDTPKLVYRWYSTINRITYYFSSVGALTFPVGMLIGSELTVHIAIFIAFYGLLFGLISRDFIALLSLSMATKVGYYTDQSFPVKHLRPRVCSICDEDVQLGSNDCVQLNCRHVFHEVCVRGWCVIGRKDKCPYCKEKVDLSIFTKNNWDYQELGYLFVLDYLRFIIVWMPIFYFLHSHLPF